MWHRHIGSGVFLRFCTTWDIMSGARLAVSTPCCSHVTRSSYFTRKWVWCSVVTFTSDHAYLAHSEIACLELCVRLLPINDPSPLLLYGKRFPSITYKMSSPTSVVCGPWDTRPCRYERLKESQWFWWGDSHNNYDHSLPWLIGGMP